MNKRFLVFGIVFILLMVGFVNASFNTVNFTTTEYDTNNTLLGASYFYNNQTNSTQGIITTFCSSPGSPDCVINNNASFFDGNLNTYADCSPGADYFQSAYIQKEFDKNYYVEDLFTKTRLFADLTASTATGYIELYVKNSSGSWVYFEQIANDTATHPINIDIPITSYNIDINEVIGGVRIYIRHDSSFYQSGTNAYFYELSYTINEEFNNTNQTFENGSYEGIAIKEDYHPLYKNFTIPSLTSEIVFSGMYNSLLTITATDNSTGSPINTFNASIELKNGSTISYGTTTGSIEIPALDGETYNITVSSDAAQYVTSTEEVTISGFTDSYNFNVYTFNSVRINVYDGLDNGLMSQNVTIQTISELSAFENITATGTILIDFLTPNDYEIRFISDGYNTVSKFITVSNDSTQIVNAYMILNNDSESQQVHVTNIGTPINTDMEGAIVRLQQENIGGDSLYVTIQESITNSEGDTNVWVVRDASTFYRFQVVYEGETLLTTTKTAFLPSVTETIELIVDTSEAGDSILEEDASLSYSTVWSGVNNETFTFDWSDASSTIVGGRLLVTGQYLNISLAEQTLSDVSFVGSSGTLQYTLPLLNNTKYTVYAYITYSDDEKLVYESNRVFNSNVLVDPNTGILMAALVFIITIFATYLLGPLWSGIIGFSSLMLLTLLNIIILPVTIITSFIAFFALMFIKIRRGQQ